MKGLDDKRAGIAIIGMAGRFPMAPNLQQFWNNLCAGVDAISRFSKSGAANESPANAAGANWVGAQGLLEAAEWFDAEFFGIKPREADLMDPQHRVFLECSWEALESAGYVPDQFPGSIGVFASSSMNTYWRENLLGHPDLSGPEEGYELMLGNDKDYLPTRVSYKLNLRGPSLNIQTACSSSLVAVSVACQHLLAY